MDDDEPFSFLAMAFDAAQHWEFWLSLIIFFILLLLSGLISSSEIAFFSLSPDDKQELQESKDPSKDHILKILEKPQELLAVILITNNFVNIGIVIISGYIFNFIYPLVEGPLDVLRIFLEIVVITFIILLFGEIMPKVYANRNSLKVAKIMAKPLYNAGKIPPFSWLKVLLVNGSDFIVSKAKRKAIEVSTDDLETAIALTREENSDDEEQRILEGIVNFGNTDVKQIMCARIDAEAIDISKNFKDVLDVIIESGYSRIPAYEGTFDEVKGILFVKDLLPYLNESKDFDWVPLLRDPFFVPENKKIDDLLKDFQERKMHMAVVVDEYGGASGIVTLEDVLEEIVGEITDEFDDENIVYTKVDDFTYVFEGKTALVDMYKMLDLDGKIFEEIKGESDSIGGFLIEQSGKIMLNNESIEVEDIKFIVESSDRKRIKMVKVILPRERTE
jgi:gliding motility-associated protein GldE